MQCLLRRMNHVLFNEFRRRWNGYRRTSYDLERMQATRTCIAGQALATHAKPW